MKLYSYPHSDEFIHNNYPGRENILPLQKEGKDKHTIPASPDECDFFHIGQINDLNFQSFNLSNYEFLSQYPSRHIVDIEGDWPAWRELPEELKRCVLIINGAHQKYASLPFLCVRPTFSAVFLFLIKHPPEFIPNTSRILGFCGKIGRSHTRQEMERALQLYDKPKNFISRGADWHGQTPPHTTHANDYIQTMKECSFALCPNGDGIDTVRLYESCLFGRIPVLMGDNLVMGYNDYDTSFIFRLPADAPQTDMLELFNTIYELPDSEIEDRQIAAIAYSKQIILHYFSDPTNFLIEFITKKGLYK